MDMRDESTTFAAPPKAFPSYVNPLLIGLS
jgi:hypothetical protein